MTHVISLLNMKGGVGKTTSTVILGEFLAGELGRKSGTGFFDYSK